MRGAFAVWVMLGLLSPALAQDETRYERARQQASEAFSAGQYEEAAGFFQQAFEASPKGNLLYNIGLCYEKAGNNAQAVAFYQRFVEAMPASPKRPAVQRRIVELRETLKGNMVTLDVSSDPPGAIIFIDEKSKGAMGNAPVSVDLLPGEYTVIAELKGYEPATQRVSLAEGRGERVSVSLVPQGQVGSVTLLVTERGANIMIDKKKVGTSPLTEPVRLRAGTHEVMVMKPGFAAWKKDIEVAAKSEQNLRVSLEPEGGGLAGGGGGEDTGGGGGGKGGNIWPWVVVGAGALAIGGGVYTGISAQSLYDQLDTKRKNEELVAASDIDVGNNLVLTTNVLLGVGSAAVIGGVAWWLLGDSGVETEGSLSGGFGVTADGASVGLSGSF